MSNYPMCILKLQARSEQGNVANLLTVYFNRNDVGNGNARSFPLSTKEAEIREAVEALSTGDYTVSVEVTVSTGEVFTPLPFPFRNNIRPAVQTEPRAAFSRKPISL